MFKQIDEKILTFLRPFILLSRHITVSLIRSIYYRTWYWEKYIFRVKQRFELPKKEMHTLTKNKKERETSFTDLNKR